jgi:MFS transporter, ACS family, tartrate transporter
MTTSSIPPAITDRLMRRIAWRLAPLMIVMYVANQLDRANIGYASLTMNAELGLTAAQYGLAASLFFLGYILFEVPSNLCAHRFGARVWMTRILLTWGTVSSLTSLVPNATWLYAARFVLGVCEAGLFPGMVYYMTLWMPARNRVWMMSLFITAIPLTGVLGAPISTWLMTHLTLFGLTGWRAMIFLEGLPSIALGIVAWFCLADNPASARWLSAAEKAEIAAALRAERTAATTSASPVTPWETLRNARVWALGVVYFGMNTGVIGLLYFLPLVVKSFEAAFHVKYSVIDVGLVTAIPFGTAVILTLIWGHIVSRRHVTAMHVAGPLLVCAAALSVALLLNSPYQAVIAFAIGTSACFCTMSTFWQLPSRFLTDRAAAAGIALITGIGVSSGFLLPYFIGWIKDVTGTFAPAFIAIAAMMVIAAAVVIMLEARLRVEAAASVAVASE